MTISWQTSCVELLRHLINDVDRDNLTYTDERLTRLLVVSAFQILTEADFSQDFSVVITTSTITPDPTDIDGGTNDDNFVNLMCLKAACILANGTAILAANNATAGKDTVSSWDLRGVAENTIALLEKGWCKVYQESLDGYLSGDGTVGAAVTGPFRTKVRGYFPYY